MAAKAATTSIPIVFTFAGDPVKEGYVASLNRPGGNVTGITWFDALVSAKARGLLDELVPNAAVIAVMTNPKFPESARALSDTEEAARRAAELDHCTLSGLFERLLTEHCWKAGTLKERP